jgi:hypothetical protein
MPSTQKNMHMTPRDKPFTVDAYLKKNNIPYTKIEPLSDGCNNFIWRIQSLNNNQIILKYAEQHSKFDTTLSWSPERAYVEGRGLQNAAVL